MKQNGTRHQARLSVILGKFIYIGFSAQIVFGMIWIVKNLGYIQLFGDSASVVTLANNLYGNGDIGILYPAVVQLAGAIGKITHIPWYSIVYLFQLILALRSGYCFIREAELFGKKKTRAVWGSFVILTFPLIMQLHMAILVNSLLLSLLMLEAAMVVRVWRDSASEKRTGQDLVFDLSGVTLLWMLLAITRWVFIFIGAVPVLVSMIKVIREAIRKFRAREDRPSEVMKIYSRRVVLLSLMTVAVFTGLIIGVDNLTTNRSISTREEFSIDNLLFERMAWKSRFSRQSTWLLEITDVIDTETMTETMRHQENVKLLMEPALVEAVGHEEANKLIKFTNEVVWDYDRKEFLHDIAIDSAGYLAPQFMVRMFMQKNSYITYTARNYDIFKRNTPVLAKRYMDYSLLWFMVAAGACVLLYVMHVVTGTREKRKDISGAIAVIIVTCIMIAVRNVMLGSSVYDYKEAGSTMAAWFMAIFTICGKSIYDEDVK